MKFQGTKGNWKCVGNSVYVQSNKPKTIADCENRHLKGNEEQYNALLISKAPEMLEMLKRCADAFDSLHQPFISDNIKQLIKEATQL